MIKFHYEILSKEQKELLSILGKLKSKFVLGGGTAIALQLGHRKSIDFDFFELDANYLNMDYLIRFERQYFKKKILLIDTSHHRDIVVNGVKISYIAYPFKPISFVENTYVKMPSLLDLASMKAYAIGRRTKWKDYVDLYFLIQKFGLSSIVNRSKKIFNSDFSEKMFIRQLGYFDYIDHTEKVDYVLTDPPHENEIKEYLKNIAVKNIL